MHCLRRTNNFFFLFYSIDFYGNVKKIISLSLYNMHDDNGVWHGDWEINANAYRKDSIFFYHVKCIFTRVKWHFTVWLLIDFVVRMLFVMLENIHMQLLNSILVLLENFARSLAYCENSFIEFQIKDCGIFLFFEKLFQ